MSRLADRDPLGRSALVFLRTIDELRLPVLDDHVTLEQLRDAASASDEPWPVQILDRLRWERQVIERLNRGAVEYDNRSFSRPLAELFDELSEEAADLGAWAAIADHALARCDGLEEEQRSLIGEALRDAAVAGAEAWARIEQARALLAAEGRAS